MTLFYNQDRMEIAQKEDDCGNMYTINNKVMMMVKVIPTSLTKSLDFARIVKLVIMFSAIALSCFVLYLASSNNFTQIQFSNFTFSHQFGIGINNGTSTTKVVDDGLIHDEYYELRKALKAASMEDKTVILTTLNEAWAKPDSLFDIFLEGFKVGNNTSWLLNHLLVIAVDERAYNRCESMVSHCYYFKSNRSIEMAKEATFMSPIYLDMMWERLAFLQTILSLGHNFVFTDTDIMWLRNPFPYFYPDADFQTSCDHFNGNPIDLNNYPNNGFNFVRSNNRTIEFYKYWVSSRWRYPDLHEQNVFNMIKHHHFIKEIGLKMMFLDTDYFGGFCMPSRDFNKVCTMHANCCVGLDKKIGDLHTTLEDWKNYTTWSSNPRATPNTTLWRVPSKCRHR